MLARSNLIVSDALARAVADAAATEPDVAAANVFGSQASGRATPLSDVDVGLLLVRTRDPDAIAGRVTDALCRRLRTGRIDVVIAKRLEVQVLEHRLCFEPFRCRRIAAEHAHAIAR